MSPRMVQKPRNGDTRSQASLRDIFGWQSGSAGQARAGKGEDGHPLAGDKSRSDHEPVDHDLQRTRSIPPLRDRGSSERGGADTIERVDHPLIVGPRTEVMAFIWSRNTCYKFAFASPVTPTDTHTCMGTSRGVLCCISPDVAPSGSWSRAGGERRRQSGLRPA